MDEERFDALLRASGEREPVPQALLDRVVEGARPVRGRRRPILIGGALAAGLLVAAAATSDQWMHQEPFQSIPIGTYRVQEPVTVRWTMADGERDTCFAFLEYSDLGVGQSERADAWVRAHAGEFAGTGQRLVDAAGVTAGSYEVAEKVVLDGLDAPLRDALATALPDVSTDPFASGPRVSGYAIHCERDR